MAGERDLSLLDLWMISEYCSASNLEWIRSNSSLNSLANCLSRGSTCLSCASVAFSFAFSSSPSSSFPSSVSSCSLISCFFQKNVSFRVYSFLYILGRGGREREQEGYRGIGV